MAATRRARPRRCRQARRDVRDATPAPRARPPPGTRAPLQWSLARPPPGTASAGRVEVHAPARGEICCVFRLAYLPKFPRKRLKCADELAADFYSTLVPLAILRSDVLQTRPPDRSRRLPLFWHPRARDARGEQRNRHPSRKCMRTHLNYPMVHARGELGLRQPELAA